MGIGGAGMSGLASILLAEGVDVSGSDLRGNREVSTLRDAGAAIHLGHDQRCVDSSLDQVVISSAIPSNNVEVVAARERRIPVIARLHAVADLMRRYRSIGVAGTHGKTTTSAMVATILREVGRDPSYLIGAHCPSLGGNAHLGRGEWFAAEIDESDGLFVAVTPTVAVVTNIGKDHLYTYGDLDAIKTAFSQYVAGSEHAVLSIDDANTRALALQFPDALTVGVDDDANLRAENVQFRHFCTRFDVIQDGRHVGQVKLHAPGMHNVRNALCALGAAALAGVPVSDACRALTSFALPSRRFELLDQNGVIVVDDYAHLPEEVEATLDAIRAGWPDRRIVAVFQPHRYTRTRDVGTEFGRAFQRADMVIVTDIYPASETPLSGVTSRSIVEAIQSQGDVDVFGIAEKSDALGFLKREIRTGDFVISFGAGDIWAVSAELSAFLKQRRLCPASRPCGACCDCP